jgi:transposase InsO family protein
MRVAMRLDGPHVSVATLQAWCPLVSRRAIAAWRRHEWQRRRREARVVQWHAPGRVWAMDFSHAPQPIEGRYRALLHVRDLASQCHLAALPVPRLSAPTVCGLVHALCAVADPPLVLKVDNGSAFRSHQLRAWAAAVGTQLLYSPPRTPRYNGAIEGSIGALTTRAHHAAVADGHPDAWTCADVEAARLAANTVPARPTQPSALDRWQHATAITGTERRQFATACAAAAHAITTTNRAMQQRTAIVDTLQRLGYVSITRRAHLVHQLNSKPRQELRA